MRPPAPTDGCMRSNRRHAPPYHTPPSNPHTEINDPSARKARGVIRETTAQPARAAAPGPAEAETPSQESVAFGSCRRQPPPSPRVFLPLVLALASRRLARPAPASRSLPPLLVLVQGKLVILLPALKGEEKDTWHIRRMMRQTATDAVFLRRGFGARFSCFLAKRLAFIFTWYRTGCLQ